MMTAKTTKEMVVFPSAPSVVSDKCLHYIVRFERPPASHCLSRCNGDKQTHEPTQSYSKHMQRHLTCLAKYTAGRDVTLRWTTTRAPWQVSQATPTVNLTH